MATSLVEINVIIIIAILSIGLLICVNILFNWSEIEFDHVNVKKLWIEISISIAILLGVVFLVYYLFKKIK